MARVLKLALAPVAIVALQLAFLFPELTERWYGEMAYPLVVRWFAAVNRSSSSYAEIGVGAAIALVPFAIYLSIRGMSRRQKLVRLLGASWFGAGITLTVFLLLWGFNYARPSLPDRLGLSPVNADARRVLEAGKRAARLTTMLFAELRQERGPTEMPFSLEELATRVDLGYHDLGLPGDFIDSATTPAKMLRSSVLFSHLGISGIFVPFTGEPSVNTLQPDVSLPMVVAHEKAHQRGITHEGDASFAAFLVCSRETADVYLRYSAYLFATRRLIGEASYTLPRNDVLEAWKLIGPGPVEDLAAIQDFWSRYEGAASATASRVNDRYLRAFGVNEGVASYGRVVELLMALDEEGRLLPENR
ncbi:MAG TPA: DUF3810 domain-containing protein [Vicinamibacteria bacterium]|nr:DUF3810 domain-containing protein [Vicinamibacteria bacterium]